MEMRPHLGFMSQPIISGFINFMQDVIMIQSIQASPTSNNVSKKILNIDIEVSSSKNSMRQVHIKNKKSDSKASRDGQNKMWLLEHDNYLTPIPNALTRKDGKYHESIKRPSFT